MIGLDSITDYYDVNIKYERLAEIEALAKSLPKQGDLEGLVKPWLFIKGNLADKTLIDQIFAEHKPAVVVNLAAQAGALQHHQPRLIHREQPHWFLQHP